MATIRVKISGFEKFEKEQIIKIRNLSEKQIKEIAIQTQNTIRRNINASLARPGSTGNLENTFYAERITVGSWGVGNIQVLNTKAPYWRHVNYGSLAINADFKHAVPSGTFSPGIAKPDQSAFRSGRWNPGTISGNGSSFSFVAGRPIEPHNFIQRTIAEIPRIINTTLRITSKGF